MSSPRTWTLRLNEVRRRGSAFRFVAALGCPKKMPEPFGPGPAQRADLLRHRLECYVGHCTGIHGKH